jgi:hypothetical protein
MIGMDAYECEPQAVKDKNVDDFEYVDPAAVPQMDWHCFDGDAVPPLEETLARRMRTTELGLCRIYPFAPRQHLSIRSSLIEALAIGSFSRRWVLCESSGPSSADRLMTGPFEKCKPPWIDSSLLPVTYRQLFHDRVNERLKPHKLNNTVTQGVICSQIALTEQADVYMVRLRVGQSPTVDLYGNSGIFKQLCLNELTLRAMLTKFMSSAIVVFSRMNWFVPVAPLQLIALARGLCTC